MRRTMDIRIRKRLPALIASAFFLAGMFSCTRVRVEPPGLVETGIASWYGPGFHGQTTSNREIYDMYDLTAAHRALPFQTHVMVTNLDNNRSVMVRINDRGPFVKDRIIDLSYAAARMLDMIEPGTARVRIEVVPDLSPDPDSIRFSVQIGSFSVRKNAEETRKRLKRRYPDIYVTSYRTGSREYHRVRIKARDRDQALALARRLRDDGYPVLILEEW